MKPCPWCKDMPDVFIHPDCGIQVSQVRCDCGAEGPVARNDEEAEKAWDDRDGSISSPESILTPAEFMAALYHLCDAIGRITLGRPPESVEAMNAASMAETLYLRIKQQELCGHRPETIQVDETEQWGTGQ